MNAERDARNQALRREVNEHIVEIATSWGATRAIDVLCECGRADCLGLIGVPAELYQRVRDEPRRFIVFAEHRAVGNERVLADHGDFVVVESLDPSGAVADETWTRRGRQEES